MKAKSFQDITFFGTTTIGEKGQVVIPAEIRKKLNIKNGGKFIVFLAPTFFSLRPGQWFLFPLGNLERWFPSSIKNSLNLRSYHETEANFCFYFSVRNSDRWL